MSSNSVLARNFAIFALILFATCGSRAQAQPASTSSSASFEVASVRMVSPYSRAEVESGVGNHPFGPLPSNRFTGRHVSIDLLIAQAFGYDSARVIEAGNEMRGAQLYDVDAKDAGDQQLTLEQMRPLLQNLLKQRFGLVVHTDEKVVAGYVLTVARNGPRLKASKPGSGENNFMTQNRIYGRGIETGSIVGMLAARTGSPVVDHTGLNGTYDVDVRFRPSNDIDSNLPDIFTAVQEQLGLKLVPAKVPVRYLVIDQVDRVPTEN